MDTDRGGVAPDDHGIPRGAAAYPIAIADDAIFIVLSSVTTGLAKKVLLDRRMLDLRLAYAL